MATEMHSMHVTKSLILVICLVDFISFSAASAKSLEVKGLSVSLSPEEATAQVKKICEETENTSIKNYPYGIACLSENHPEDLSVMLMKSIDIDKEYPIRH